MNKVCPKCYEDMILIDDSFDHEFGTEVIKYWLCEACEHDEDYDGVDFDYDCDYYGEDFEDEF